MADSIVNKEELNIARNLATEFLNILDTKRKMAAASLAELNIQKQAIQALEHSDAELFKRSMEVLDIKQKILDTIKSHKKVNQADLETDKSRYVIASNILKQLVKQREEELANQEKIKKGWEDIDSKFGGIVKKGREIKSTLNLSPALFLAGTASSILLYTFKKIWDVFDQLDSAAADFRKSMGIMRIDSIALEANVRDMAVNMMALGVTAKNLYDSIRAIADELGSSQSYTADMVKDMSLLTAQFGISAQTSAKFLKTMAMVSGSTASVQRDMLLVAQRMSAAAGVPLDAIMADIAESSQESYQFLSRSPLSLVKSAIQAKLLGTSLSASAKSSASLLNFTESVKNEMEASVLLGKSMNLQKARELAYHRDITGLNREIVKLAKEANFEQLDPFQQDAVAKALGKSAGEVASMLESDREHDKVLRAMTQEQRKQYDVLTNTNQSQIKDYAEIARGQIQQISNQKAIAAISAAWTSIFARIGQSVLPLIATVLTSIAKTLAWAADAIGKLENKVSSISGWAGKLLKIVIALAAAAALLVGAKGLGKLVGWATGGIGKGISSLFGGVAEGVGKFGGTNVLKGVLGIALLGVSLFIFAKALGAFANVKWSAVFIGIGALVLLGALAGVMGALAEFIIPGAIAIGILGLALIPFAAAAWIASKALQNLSNVPLGNIASGLLSLGMASPFIAASGIAMAIAAPGMIAFSLALRLLAGPAERVGKAMAELGTGMKMTVDSLTELKSLGFISTISQLKSLAATIRELSKAINEMPEIKIEKLKSFSLPSNNTTAIKGTEKKEGSDMLGAIKDGIEGLRSDLKSGLLTANVYIDSQKLDSAVGRRLAYTGALT